MPGTEESGQTIVKLKKKKKGGNGGGSSQPNGSTSQDGTK